MGDKLMDLYKGDSNSLIADVDCTAGGKDLCEEVGVQGFPTIKHGDPNNLEDYEGGRDFESLKTFAKENLGPKCGPANLDLCDAAQKEKINEFMAMPIEDLESKIKEKEDEMAQANTDFEEFLKGLQNQYEEKNKETEEKKKEIKDSGLGMLKAVQAQKKKSKSEL